MSEDGNRPEAPRPGEARRGERLADERRPRSQPPGERGGPKGPEPTRFGDWEKNGRCSDF